MPIFPRMFIFTLLFATSLAIAESTPVVTEAEVEDNEFKITTATCGDVFDLFSDATPAEGKDPEVLEEAQDDVLYFVIWVHGYLSGRVGIDPGKRPLSKEGIELTIEQIAGVCKADESKRFLNAVQDIK